MRKYFAVLFLLLFNIMPVISEDIKFILHDKCINALYKPAVLDFENSKIAVYRDSRGIILRFELKNPEEEYFNLSEETLSNLINIEHFLAKIKNAVIIEVHTVILSRNKLQNLKNWEISSVIAGKIEKTLCSKNNLLNNRIHSVGYGEFLPENNTPNNGGKLSNRVDIIILCNVSGE